MILVMWGPRSRLSGLAGLLAAVASLAVVAAAPAAAGGPDAPCQPSDTITCPAVVPDQILSNETTFTTWATMLTANPVRQQPSGSAPKVSTLHATTEDGFPEVYIVLRTRQVGTRTWAEVRLPMRPAGRTGWVPRDDLDTFHKVTTELVLTLSTQRIRLYRAGRKVLEIPAGIGTPSTPTPPGHFWIREAFPVSGVGAYGPYAFGTSAYSNLTDWPGGGVVGLHGTNEPGLIPGRPSHGCIRVRNADILRLARLVRVGTPLLVQ
jgi:lipoprotein-anchoring transpeptidase ErfK/SrfK